MSLGLTFTITGTEKTLARLQQIRGGMAAAMRRALSDGIMKVHRRASLNLSGRVLRVQTGRLRQSLQTSVEADGSAAVVGTNVEYARIHEYGGRTGPHAIFPRNLSGALRFPRSGLAASLLTTTRRGTIRRGAYNAALLQFAHAVQHPGSVMPARPYMRPALVDSVDDIRAAFRRHIGAALKGEA